jgi:S-adenosylmethionine:tRNA ribosyltransferase-isomerase
MHRPRGRGIGADGDVRALEGWAGPVVTPERGVRVVDGLHEPEASHLLTLEAVAGRAAIDRGYEEAVHGRHLWHEFGGGPLLLSWERAGETPHAMHCSSNQQ